jgi:hypothetical protein
MQSKPSLVLFKFICFFLIAIAFSCKKDVVDQRPNIVLFHPATLSISAYNSYGSLKVSMYFRNNVDSVFKEYVEYYLSNDMHYAENEDIKIGSSTESISYQSTSINKYVFIPSSITIGNYYLIAKYRAANDSNSFFAHASVYISQTPSHATLTGLSLDKATYYEGEYASLSLNYKSKLLSTQEVTFEIYIAQDSSFSNTSDDNKVSTFYGELTGTEGTIPNQSFYLPSISTTGLHYLMVRGYYNNLGSTASIAPIKKSVQIKSLAEALTVSVPKTTKTSYVLYETLNFSMDFTNSSSQTINPTLYYYLSKDKSIDSNDVLINTQNSLYVYSGSNSYNLYADIPFVSAGSYYLLVSYKLNNFTTTVTSSLITIKNS